MKDDHNSPDFPSEQYVRPNLDWECGHLSKGCPCRIGPSPRGMCRATYECSPLLEIKTGEVKGHWRCTRPATAGGKCENGPSPDGTCCKAIPKCQPRRTLRAIRKRVVTFTVITTFLIIVFGLSNNRRDEFINPGPISSVHASEHFAKSHKEMSGGASSCAACHEGAREGLGSWHAKALDAFKHGMAPSELVERGPIEASAMDNNCLACHQGKDFHQPNMAAEFACHSCHKEHVTSGFMPEVNDSYCTSCHGSGELMAESKALGSKTNPHSFPSFSTIADLKVQPRERPEGGYTDVITAFHVDHPEFRQIKEGVKDTNALKFNHEIHFGGDIPRKLNCADCHERDSRGEYQRPITYEKHCAECHTLQFDPNTVADENKPGLYLPHGDPSYVRAFLRSLNIHYGEYGRLHEGLTSPDELDDYVREKTEGIETLYETGEHLERSVFFADMNKLVSGGQKVPFAGCATCHEVTEPLIDNATPGIKDVAIPDRWMTLGRFDHDLHRNGLTCLDCHDVMSSKLTSDLNLPSVKSCAECHSPKGGIDHRCITCHSYHNTKPAALFEKSPASLIKPDEAKDVD